MLRFDKLTVKAQEALQAAQEMGARSGQQQIEPLHLLWALAAQGDGVVPPLLEKLGVSPIALGSEAEKQIERLPKVSGVSDQSLSRASNAVLEKAFDEAQRLKDEYVSTEHILLAIAGADRDPAAHLLAHHGASHDAILQAMISIRGSHRVTSQNPESTYRAIEQYGRDLTDSARRGKLDPVIGRDEEKPGTDRRTRSRQNRHRRGPRAAYRLRRCPGSSQAEAHRRARPVGDGC